MTHPQLKVSTFVLASGWTLLVTGGMPLVVQSLSDITINGTIDCSGSAGADLNANDLATTNWGRGRCGGADGGRGGSSTTAPLPGSDAGTTITGGDEGGAAGGPGPSSTNLWIEAGKLSPEEIVRRTPRGLLVTELIGMGVNGITGDYSRGAAGFMIRDGAIAEPVAEITIAGNLSDMFAHLTPANDLRFRRGTDAPTVRVDGMTMAGA